MTRRSNRRFRAQTAKTAIGIIFMLSLMAAPLLAVVALNPVWATGYAGTVPLPISVANGGTALTALGSPLQVLRVNAGGTGLEYATLSSFSNPMTTTGDLIYSSDNSGTPARRGIGSANDLLTVSGGLPTWAAPSFAASAITSGQLSAARGGTGADLSGGSSGQIPRANGSGAFALSTATYPSVAGTSGNVLTSDGTNWTSAAPTGMTNPMTTTGDMIVSSDGSGTPARFNSGALNVYSPRPRIYRSVLFATTAATSYSGSVGWAMGTINGTTTASLASTGQYIKCDSAAATDSEAGCNGGTNICTIQNKPRLWAHIKTGSSLATLRCWVGFTSATPMASDDPVGVDMAAFRYCPATDGTAFWRTYTNDGSSTGTATTTSVAIATDTDYELCVDASNAPTNVKFYINGALVATHTTDLPTGTTTMATYGKVRTLENVAKTLYVGSWLLDQEQ